MKNKPKAVLRLYVRHDCHLCDVMKQQLLEVRDDYGFDFEVHDIDARKGDMRHYSEMVPVLLWGRDVVCYHRLDLERLAAVLDAPASGAGGANP